MKKRLKSLLENDLFLLLINGVLAHTAFTAVMIFALNVPPEAILEIGLQEVLLVFEG
jgi:hypothetical protein